MYFQASRFRFYASIKTGGCKAFLLRKSFKIIFKPNKNDNAIQNFVAKIERI